MFFSFYNFVVFIIKFQKIESSDIICNEKSKTNIMQKEKKVINSNEKIFEKISTYNIKNYIDNLPTLKTFNSKQRKTLSKFIEMKKFFDEKKDDKNYESFLHYFKARSFKENSELSEFIYENILKETSYLGILEYINVVEINNDENLKNLIDDLYEIYKISLKKLEIFKTKFFNFESIVKYSGLELKRNAEIMLNLKIEDLYKFSNYFCIKENIDIIREFISYTTNNIRFYSITKLFLHCFMDVETQYWCLYHEIRRQINLDDSKTILFKVEDCIKRYSNIIKNFSELKIMCLNNQPKIFENYKLFDKRPFIFITRYLETKNLFQEIENFFCTFKYNNNEEYIDLYNQFIENRSKYLDFCCHIDFENPKSYEFIISNIDYLYENFKAIKYGFAKIVLPQRKRRSIRKAFTF